MAQPVYVLANMSGDLIASLSAQEVGRFPRNPANSRSAPSGAAEILFRSCKARGQVQKSARLNEIIGSRN
jgi:hypothetical protein